MSKTLNRLVVAVGLMAAPLMMIGCAEGEKPAATPPPADTKPADAAPPADTKPADAAAPAPAPTAPAEAPK
jgi:hypothetical protein